MTHIIKMNTNKESKTRIASSYFCLILIVLSVLAITGCGPGSGFSNQPTMKDIRKGSKGLELEFVRNAPPDKIFQNDPNVYINVMISNLGASDIVNGVLAIGREDDYLSIKEILLEGKAVSEPVVFSLEGKSLDNPVGGLASLEINAVSKEISLSKYQDSSIRITACYDYHTIFEDSVCLDPIQDRNEVNARACKGGDFSASSQGAPVNVKTVSILSKRVSSELVRHILRIKVGNDGYGKVVVPGVANELCSEQGFNIEGLDYRNVWDLVKIRARLGLNELDCKNDGIVRLAEGRSGEAICELDSNQLGEFVTSLVVELDYGYTFTKSKEFKIEKI